MATLEYRSIPDQKKKVLGQLIKVFRIKNNIPQSKLIGNICTRDTLSSIENGKSGRDYIYYEIIKNLGYNLVIDEELDDSLQKLISTIFDCCYYFDKKGLASCKEELDILLSERKETFYYKEAYNILNVIIDYYSTLNLLDKYNDFFSLYDLFGPEIEQLMLAIFYQYYWLVSFNTNKMDFYMKKLQTFNTPFASYHRMYTFDDTDDYIQSYQECIKLESELLAQKNIVCLLNLYHFQLTFMERISPPRAQHISDKAQAFIDDLHDDLLIIKYKRRIYYEQAVRLMMFNKHQQAIEYLEKFISISFDINDLGVYFILSSYSHKHYSDEINHLSELVSKNQKYKNLMKYFSSQDDKEKTKLLLCIFKDLKEMNHYPLINAFEHECLDFCKRTKQYKLFLEYHDTFSDALEWTVEGR